MPERLRLQAEAVRMYSLRRSYKDIGEALGIHSSTAFKYVRDAFKDQAIEQVDEARKRDISLIDHLINRLLAIVDDPSSTDSSAKTNAAGTINRLLDRRAKMLGVDTPAQSEVTVTHQTPEDLELRDLINAAKARAALPVTDEVPRS
ncbi:hypothetical protein ACIBSW_34475 [Actinoplanes sp. NPDC049668]|uniref:hypothetical protein n=1 Tax=unclassified Actinoplanes TaxID=2626549 RepID=UPI0033A3DB61